MASLQRQATGVFHIVFRFGGTRYKRSLGTKNKSNANVKRTEIRETIDLIKRGRIEIPEDAQVPDTKQAAIDQVFDRSTPNDEQ